MKKISILSLLTILLISPTVFCSDEQQAQEFYTTLTTTTRTLIMSGIGATGLNVLLKTAWIKMNSDSLENTGPLTQTEKHVFKQLMINAGTLVGMITFLSFIPAEAHEDENERFIKSGLIGASLTSLYHLSLTTYNHYFSQKIRQQISLKRLHEIRTYTRMCAICLNEDEIALSDINVLSCGHTFHDACISPWLADHTNCPKCRKNQEE